MFAAVSGSALHSLEPDKFLLLQALQRWKTKLPHLLMIYFCKAFPLSFEGKAGYNDQLPLQAVFLKAKELWSLKEPGLLSAAIEPKLLTLSPSPKFIHGCIFTEKHYFKQLRCHHRGILPGQEWAQATNQLFHLQS